MTRRDASAALPLFGLFASALAARQEAGAAPSLPAHATAFAFDKLPVQHNASGAITRPVLQGKLPTGEVIELHETTLMPGQMPHAAHKHKHSELMLIREGSVDFILDGRTEHLGPGGVAYAASGEMHGLKNNSTEPANYFVIAIGEDSASG